MMAISIGIFIIIISSSIGNNENLVSVSLIFIIVELSIITDYVLGLQDLFIY